MTAAPVPGSVTVPGRMPGGLARVLARATRPPVVVPSADAGAPRPVVHAALLDRPGDAGAGSPVVPRVVAAPRSPAALPGADEVRVSVDRSSDRPAPPRLNDLRDPAAPASRPAAPDVEVTHDEHPLAARTAPPASPPAAGPGLEPEETPATGFRPGPTAAPTAGPGAEEAPTVAAPPPAEPRPDQHALSWVTDSAEPVAVEVDPRAPGSTEAPLANRPAPDRDPQPERRDTPAPAPAAPPVVIGRIEVHVDSPAAPADPFAGCRVVAAGLTARRGGAW